MTKKPNKRLEAMDTARNDLILVLTTRGVMWETAKRLVRTFEEAVNDYAHHQIEM